jgi:aquaporin Z
MLKYFTEFVGTFIFFAVILSTGGDAVPVGVALATAIYFGGKISGGHYNPGVSFMMFYDNKLDSNDLAMYVLVQIAAAIAAVYFVKMIPKVK